MQQAALLEDPSNARIIKKVADDTETVIASRRGYRHLGSGPPSALTITDVSESTLGPPVDDIDRKTVDTNPYRKSQGPKALKNGTRERPGSTKSDASAIFNQPVSLGFEKRTLTVRTNVTKDSGFYDADADLVNPAAYREAVAADKARAREDLHRSVSDPFVKGVNVAAEIDEARDQLTPMERWKADWQAPKPFDPDSAFDDHLAVRPTRHKPSHSDSNLSPAVTLKKSSDEFRKSPWGTIKRGITRAISSPSGASGSPSPGGTYPARIGTKSVKRKSEINLHHSIDFGSEDGLRAPAIVRAAQSGSRVEIERLLEQRADIEARHDSTGRTALAVASHCGNDGVVVSLLFHGARHDVKDALGMTPLHLAASRGHYRVVKLLLQDDADVDARGAEDKAPLRLASDNGHSDCCELLLEHRARVNARDCHMFTALHAAARIGDAHLVDVLINNKADFEAKDAQLMTPMHYAAAGDFDSVVEILLAKKADVNSIGAEGKTPLCCACEYGATHTAALLMSRKANVRHQGEDNMTPLHWACQNNKPEVADLLLQHRRTIDAKTSKGRTSLHLAVWSKSFDTAELLIRKRASIEAQCSRSLRPLHYACNNGDAAISRLLIGIGADVEATSTTNLRPLHLTAMKGSEAVTALLLQKGVQIESRNSSGDRAVSLACAHGHLGVVKMLLDAGSALQLRASKGPSLEDSPLCRAARYGHIDIVRELMRRGASVRQRDENNWQPLRYAAYYGRPEVVEMLLAAKAPVLTFDVGHHVDSMTTATSIGFADEVDSASRVRVLSMLNAAQEKERTVPRRISDDDPFLTIPSLPDARSAEAVRIYEVG